MTVVCTVPSCLYMVWRAHPLSSLDPFLGLVYGGVPTGKGKPDVRWRGTAVQAGGSFASTVAIWAAGGPAYRFEPRHPCHLLSFFFEIVSSSRLIRHALALLLERLKMNLKGKDRIKLCSGALIFHSCLNIYYFDFLSTLTTLVIRNKIYNYCIF
jgi:hypothetical protein